jgi:hypothetical protein
MFKKGDKIVTNMKGTVVYGTIKRNVYDDLNIVILNTPYILGNVTEVSYILKDSKEMSIQNKILTKIEECYG